VIAGTDDDQDEEKRNCMATAKQLTAKQLTHVGRMTSVSPGALVFVEPAGTPGNYNMHIGDETICWNTPMFNHLLLDKLHAKDQVSNNTAFVQAARILQKVFMEELETE
jgi:hypothetical protein